MGSACAMSFSIPLLVPAAFSELPSGSNDPVAQMGGERAVGYRQLFETDAARQGVEEPHSAAQQVGREVDQDLVAEPGGQRLFPRRGAAELDVLSARHRARLLDGALDAIGDEGQVGRPARIV